MLSNSFSRVISHAREEYLYVYSVYVLEASTSNRLTHFYPPFNLLALLIFRPLRLFLPSNNHIRAARILLLKLTHFPIVGVIMLYELIRGKVTNDEFAGFKGPRLEAAANAPPPAYNNNNNNNGATGGGGISGMPRRKTSRAGRMMVRPASSSSQGQQQRRVSNRTSASAFEPLASTRVASVRAFTATADASIDDVDAPTEIEVKISELSNKIDKLTEIILAMQSERNGQQAG